MIDSASITWNVKVVIIKVSDEYEEHVLVALTHLEYL